MSRKMAIVLTILLAIPIIALGGDSSSEQPIDRTRAGSQDFDVQFILDPEEDPLSPYNGTKWARIEYWTKASYWVLVTNFLESTETFHVKLSQPPKDSGTNWFFADNGGIDTYVTLSSPTQSDEGYGSNFDLLLVEVLVEYSWVSNFIIEVSAVTDTDDKLYGSDASWDRDNFTVYTGHVDYIGLFTNNERIYHVDPGEWVTLPHKISNLGNKDVINVSLMVDEDDQWRMSYRDFEEIYNRKINYLEYSWVKENVLVEKGKTIFKNLSVRIPPNYANDDDVFQFRIVGRIVGSNFWATSDVMTLIVNRATDLKAVINKEGSLRIGPGSETTVLLNISNEYRRDDYIDRIYFRDPQWIDLKIDKEFDPAEGIVVPGKGKVSIPFILRSEARQSPGKYELKLEIVPRYSHRMVMDLSLVIEERVNITLLPTDPIRTGKIDIVPGMSKEIVFGIRNDGNADRSMTFTFMGSAPVGIPDREGSEQWSCRLKWVSQVREPSNFIPDESMVEFRSDPSDDLGHTLMQTMSVQLSISPGDTLWVAAEVECSDEGGLRITNPYEWKAVVSSLGGNYSNFTMLFEPVYPDLVLDERFVLTDPNGIELRTAEEGSKVIFSINVTNIGKAHSDPTILRVLLGKDIVMDIDVRSLASGESASITGNFTAEKGMGRIDLVLDPDNTVIETDDQFMEGSIPGANVQSAVISVGEGGEHPDLRPILIILAVLSILALFLLFALSKRKKAVED